MSVVTEAFGGKRLVLKDRDDGVVLASVDPRVPSGEATMVAFQLAAQKSIDIGAMDARMGAEDRAFGIVPGTEFLLVVDGGGDVFASSWVCGFGDLGRAHADRMLDLVRRAYGVGRGHVSEAEDPIVSSRP